MLIVVNPDQHHIEKYLSNRNESIVFTFLFMKYAKTNDFEGNISCVQMYNKALLSTEVLQNYNALKGRFN